MAEKNEKLLGLIPVDWRYDIASLPHVRKILKSRLIPFSLIVFNLAFFSIILLAGITGGLSAGNYNFGIMFVWILWWVLLMLILVPLLSRFWCSMCPLPAFGEWIQRTGFIRVNNKLAGLQKKWPKKLKNMWLMNFLFLGTTYTSGFLTTRPISTFILLMTIILGSIMLSVMFEKRSFCLYVCPVSGFQGLYSNMGMTEIRAKDSQVCRNHNVSTRARALECDYQMRDCVRGNERGYACPWNEKPFNNQRRNTYCGMCFECFKTCPYDNMAFNVRPPAVDLLLDKKRGLDEAWKSFMMMGIAMFFFLIMQGPFGFLKDWANGKTLTGYLSYIAIHASFNMLIFPAIFFIFAYVSNAVVDKKVSLRNVFINFSYTLVPLGLMAWIGFSLGIIFANGSYIIHVISDPFAWGWNLFGTANFPWTPFLTGYVPYMQIAMLLLGLALSLDVGMKISKQTYKNKDDGVIGFYPIAAFLAILTIFLIWLFTG